MAPLVSISNLRLRNDARRRMYVPVTWQIFFGLAMFALVFAPLERLFPRRNQSALRHDLSTDLAYYVVGCFLGNLANSLNLWGMLLLRDATGLKLGAVGAAQPGWLQFIEILVLSDLLNYAIHRFLHTHPWFWRLHKIHHSVNEMDWLANTRLHPLDKLLGDLVQFFPILCLGFSDGPFLAYSLFLGFQGFINHANIRLNYGPLRWILTSPEYHSWHHCDDPKTYNRNFAQHLVLTDLLFGTAFVPPPGVLAPTYGVPEPTPKGFFQQLMWPFRRDSRDQP